MANMWMVRSASGGRLADVCHEKGVVAIGWGDIGDLSQFKDKQAIINAIESKWPEWSPERVMFLPTCRVSRTITS